MPETSSQDHKRVGENDTGLNTGGVDHLPILMRDGWEIATQQLHSADPAMQQAKAARKDSPEAKPTDSL